jgi:ankyrin repeat protein
MHRCNLCTLCCTISYMCGQYLLSQKANVNQLHAHGGSALMEACSSGNAALVTLLLKHGAELDVMDRDGVTA